MRLRRDVEAEVTGLWRERSFQLLWLGQTAAVAGGQVRLVVLPVLMFQLTGSATQTSLLLTVQAAPYLALGLVAGAVADRANRRVIMVSCDLASAAAMASIPTAAALATLTPAQLYVAGAVTGTTFVWHDSALFGALPTIVGRQRVVNAYSILMSTNQVLQVGATAIAGVLIAVIGAQNALWIDVTCYAVSAVMIRLIPRQLSSTRTPDAQRASLHTDIREGLRYVRHHPVVWPLTASGFGSALAGGALLGLIVVYGVRQLGLAENDAQLGWLFTALAIGGLTAGIALPALSRRVNQPRISLLGLTAMVALLVGIALTSILPISLALLVAWGSAHTLVIANGITLRQQLTPDRLQGRVNVTARMIAYGGTPIGAALGGVLADQTNIQTALLMMTLCVAASAVYAWSSPLRRTDATAITRLRKEVEQPG
ncbi:MAG TPA: MFS transporter [Pseudonocardiaceae bacterium]|nr:MFS transporter [Pseudonocardiaceae bacterium]